MNPEISIFLAIFAENSLTMKKIATALLSAAAMTAVAGNVDVEWEVVGHAPTQEWRTAYTQRFTLRGDLARLKRLGFSQVGMEMKTLNPADTVAELIPGSYYIASPRFAAGADSVVVDVVCHGTCPQASFRTDAVFGVDAAGKPFDVGFRQKFNVGDPRQWSMEGRDDMVYGPDIYALNEALQLEAAATGPFDMAPSLKSVRITSQKKCRDGRILSEKTVKADNPEFYRLTITPAGVEIEGASRAALAMARRTAKRLFETNPSGVPEAVVEDWPDYPVRGMMIDVVRNFHSLAQMKKIVDGMADLRLNRLQFHLADDEGWRLEIAALPELITYGSRRGYTTDERLFPAQIYSGAGNPDGELNHGYYTRAEFVDFLRYCDERGITVVPEFESPGHARVAIKAMDFRERTTGDSSFRLHEPADTSRYRSAQQYRDCVLNPALPGPYRFFDVVSDEVIAMYREAGVELPAFHIGGDEVPGGAWSGSPAATAFKAEHGIEDDSGLHAYWVERMAEMMARKGVKIAGWQDIATDYNDSYSARVAPQVDYVNLWVDRNFRKGVKHGSMALRSGFTPLICDFGHFYLDFAHSTHPEEEGLNWGGVIDEFKTLDGYAGNVAPRSDADKTRILGVQGQLWAETLRSDSQMERYLFPRLFALAERGWNADTTFTHGRFNALMGYRELPRLARRGYSFHLRQPGMKLDGNRIVMNSPYADAEIRYTTDGTTPTLSSPLYTGPVEAADPQAVRARLFYHGAESVTTLLPRR